ncbi:MAG: peptidylprolyl isomerase [Candidatus Cloacimonetes bacterium]|nr:peptidylprolyl isomerase [Candidatus Cloacimonadota bacterium]
MQIVAKVFDYEITQIDLERECSRLNRVATPENENIAIVYLVDRYLLFAKANELGLKVTDTEYDDALMELIDQEEPLGLSSEAIQELKASELEFLLKRYLLIQKYIHIVCPDSVTITSNKLYEFYNENQEIFQSMESVHCSHILVQQSDEAEQKIHDVRTQIKNADDFKRISMSCSDCPSNVSCGDLGWFPKGKMIKEIDDIAFSLRIGEISQPFKSSYGYHILMLLDRKESATIPFEDIKDSLHTRLLQIEKEYFLKKHIAELREQYANSIVMFSSELGKLAN